MLLLVSAIAARTALPETERFQSERLPLDIAAALGSEDHQLSGMLPGTALLDMLGLLQDERSHVAERAASCHYSAVLACLPLA
jgi:hypothetical protein